MSKKEILKGFRSEFSEYLRPKTIGVFDSILLANEFEEYLTKAIDQTREETIREVEEMLPIEKKITQKDYLLSAEFDYREGDIKEYYNNLIKNIKQSLINLRK